jgi:hypothetical protein
MITHLGNGTVGMPGMAGIEGGPGITVTEAPTMVFHE